MIEYSIKIKDEKDTLTIKEQSYEPILLSKDNLLLIGKIKEALVKFNYDPDQESPEIILKFKLIWQT
jgi:hypothetical protein